jgi:hypothetical protein
MKRNKLKFSQRPTFHLASSLANFNLPPRFLPQQKKRRKTEHTNKHASYLHLLSKQMRQNNEKSKPGRMWTETKQPLLA